MAKSYEYTTVTIYTKDCDDGDCLEVLRQKLNEYGSQGWRLTGFIQHHAEPQWYYMLVFEKEKAE